MPQFDFYNVNELRDYPLVADQVGGVPVPQSALVDFTGIMYPAAQYTEASGHYVSLNKIYRQSSVLYFEFGSNAPGMAGLSLTFCRSIVDAEYAVQRTTDTTVSDAMCTCAGFPIFEGWLTTGNLANLVALLPVDGDMITGLSVVEPARIQNIGTSFVETISIANKDRTHVTPAPGCSAGSSATGEAALPYHVNATCIVGDIVLQEGYNISIQQDSNGGTLKFTPNVGAGAGQPCSEIPLYAGEMPPAGSQFLSGGPACNEVISTINGVEGPLLQFVAGNGVNISADPSDTHTLIINFNLQGLQVCDPGSFSSEQI